MGSDRARRIPADLVDIGVHDGQEDDPSAILRSRRYVQLLQKGLIGVEARTGKVLWRFDKPVSRFNANIPTPVFGDGIAYPRNSHWMPTRFKA